MLQATEDMYVDHFTATVLKAKDVKFSLNLLVILMICCTNQYLRLTS